MKEDQLNGFQCHRPHAREKRELTILFRQQQCTEALGMHNIFAPTLSDIVMSDEYHTVQLAFSTSNGETNRRKKRTGSTSSCDDPTDLVVLVSLVQQKDTRVVPCMPNGPADRLVHRSHADAAVVVSPSPPTAEDQEGCDQHYEDQCSISCLKRRVELFSYNQVLDIS